jgi:outer membrane protein assembly factor BamB
MRWFSTLGFVLACTSLSHGQDIAADPSALKFAEATLKKAKIQLNDADLMRFFQDRTLSKEHQEKLDALVLQMGSASYKDRVQATAEILKYRDQAIPFLINGLKSDVQEIVARSSFCLTEISQQSEVSVALAAVQVLAHRKPPKATQVLLDFLPFTTDRMIIEQIRAALKTLVLPTTNPTPELVNALADPFPVKRYAAAEVLARFPALRPKVAALLRDPDLDVRFHVALALAQEQDTTALPVLIAMLDQIAPDKAWQAEDALLRIAVAETPKVYLGSRDKPAEVRKAWEKWWQTNKDKPDSFNLARLSEDAPLLGYTLITQMGLNGGLNGEVMELDTDGTTVRWKITGVRYPVQAKVIRPDRVLITEYFDRKVTERDFKGNILWTYAIQMPVGCQRLTNGNTFIVARREMVEVDVQGDKQFSLATQATSFVAAQKLPNGQIVYADSGGQIVRLNAAGKEVARFMAGNIYSTGGTLQVLSDGRILVPLYRENKVVEFSPTGNRLWEASVTYPTSATRLSNGHTLVVSLTQRTVIELNRQGEEIWRYQTEGRPWCAVRR